MKYLLMFLFVTCSILVSAVEGPKIAVYGINSSTLRTNEINVLANDMETELFDKGLFNIVERGSLAKIIEEQKLTLTGNIDPTKAAEIGKLAGADYIMIGYIEEAAWKYHVTIKILDVNTSIIVFSRTLKSNDNGNIEVLIKEIVNNIEVKDIGVQNGKKVYAIGVKASLPSTPPLPKVIKSREVDSRLNISTSPVPFFAEIYNLEMEVPYSVNKTLDTKITALRCDLGSDTGITDFGKLRGKGKYAPDYESIYFWYEAVTILDKNYYNKYYDGFYTGPEIGAEFFQFHKKDVIEKYTAFRGGGVAGYKFSIGRDVTLDSCFRLYYRVIDKKSEINSVGCGFDVLKLGIKF